MTRRSALRTLCALLLVATGWAVPAAQNRGATDIPRLQFDKYTLPNGLEVIMSQNRRLPMVAVNLWYHVGPANEEPGRTGFAHLFEHMMFQSSKHVPPDSHFKLLEAAGARGINGSTDFDRTNYFETVPSNQLELALWLESDRMGYLLEKVDQAALSNQQDVVRNERRQSFENRPYGLADEAVIQMLFPKGHPYYGNVIGSHEDIQAVRLDDVKRFFRQYYAPNNASLVLVGDFDQTEAKRLVEKYFGTLKRGPAVPQIDAETPKITAERRRVMTARVELPRVTMAWITPAIFKPGDAEADVAANILGGGRTSRLYKKLVYEKQIAQNVVAFQNSLLLGSIFRVQVTARPGHTVEEIEKAIDEEIAALRTSPPTAGEIEQVRNTIETNIVNGLERNDGVADQLNYYNHYLRDPGYLNKDIERYRAVTPASVQRFVQQHLVPGARVVVQVVPGQPAPLPEIPTPAATASSQAPAGGGESINADEPWRNEVPKAGPPRPIQLPTPTTATLPNGLTIVLNERRGLPIVAADLVLKTGSDANPPGRPGLANFVAAMLDEGTTSRNALEIADQVAQLGATLSTSSSMDDTTVFVQALSKNFAATLDLLADVVLRPSFPGDELERQRAQRLGQLAQQRDNAGQVASRVQALTLYGPDHPYGYPEIGTEAAIKALTRDEMVAFWRQNFVPNNAALVVSGDISMNDLRALAEKAFGGWQRGTSSEPRLSAPPPSAARVVIVDRPNAPQTQLAVAGIGAPRSTPDFRPLQVMNNAFGGLFSSRINMNLRERNGFTYGAGSQFVFRRGTGPFVIATAVRTDVTAPAVREILKEVSAITAEPLREEELQAAKDSLVNSLPGAFETNAGVVNNFAGVFIYGLGLDYYTKYAQQVNAVSAADALAVAKKYFVPDRMVVIAVGDRAKIEPELKKLGIGAVEIRDPQGNPAS